MKKTKRERRKIISDNEIVSPDRLFVFKLSRRYPDRSRFRRFVEQVKKRGCYYDHDQEAKTVTAVFENKASRDAGVVLLKRALGLAGEDFN